MANAGRDLRYAVVGPSISRRSNLSHRRAHSWACDEPCELNILESEKVSAALAVLQRCSNVNVLTEREPAAALLSPKPDEGNTGIEENHSTKDGSGTENEASIEPSTAGDAAQVFPSEGDFTVWPDTDSEDGYNFSTWDIRRGSDGTESASTPVTAEVPDECMSLEGAAVHSCTAPTPQEPDWPRSHAIKVRTGMVIDELTTLMIRNLPTNLQQDKLVVELDKAGFSGLYDFCHLPVWTASGTRKGYAFVNMINQEAAEMLSTAWHKKRQACLGMKPDDQALDIVAANIQGLEANLAMLKEPRKKRGGKAARSAKGKGHSEGRPRVRSTSTKTSSPADSPKAPSMPPGTFHDLASPTRFTGKGAARASDAASTKGDVLGILGFPSPQVTQMSLQGPGAMTAMAAITPPSCAPCSRLPASPMVLSVPAHGVSTGRSVPR